MALIVLANASNCIKKNCRLRSRLIDVLQAYGLVLITRSFQTKLLNLSYGAYVCRAYLLRHVDALLGRLEAWHELGDVSTGPLGLQRALLLRGVLHHRLGLVETFFFSLK